MTQAFIKNILAEELFGYRLCESISDQKIVNFFYNNLLLEKLLYGEPISVPELRKLLRKKIVNFEFIKLDGEVRPAKGTTMMKYIPPSDHPKGIRPSSPKVATFFDLDKDAWRSVSKRSKEIVLKKDKETGKPIVVVKDAPKVKIKAISKERESSDGIEQGKSYKYVTNRGTNTDIEIIRELPNGLFQVSSPLFKTTFAIDPTRIGDEFTSKEPEVKDIEPKEQPLARVEEPEEEPKEPTDVIVKDIKPKEKTPEVKIRDVEAKEHPTPKVPEKPEEEPEEEPGFIPAPEMKPTPSPEIPDTTILLPQEIEPESEEDTTKAPPIDITPPPSEEEEPPEELER